MVHANTDCCARKPPPLLGIDAQSNAVTCCDREFPGSRENSGRARQRELNFQGLGLCSGS
eukprot:12421030-Karenia_brevis.AAC.1